VTNDKCIVIRRFCVVHYHFYMLMRAYSTRSRIEAIYSW